MGHSTLLLVLGHGWWDSHTMCRCKVSPSELTYGWLQLVLLRFLVVVVPPEFTEYLRDLLASLAGAPQDCKTGP